MLEHKPTVAPVPSGPLATAKHRRWRSIIVVLLVGLVNLALLTVIGFQLVTPAQHQVQSSPLVDRPAPDFTLASLSQAPAVHLAQWRGHVVMINFWASWCEPCKHEAPLLQATWQQMKNQGIIFLGVDYMATPSKTVWHFFSTTALPIRMSAMLWERRLLTMGSLLFPKRSFLTAKAS